MVSKSEQTLLAHRCDDMGEYRVKCHTARIDIDPQWNESFQAFALRSLP